MWRERRLGRSSGRIRITRIYELTGNSSHLHGDISCPPSPNKDSYRPSSLKIWHQAASLLSLSQPTASGFPSESQPPLWSLVPLREGTSCDRAHKHTHLKGTPFLPPSLPPSLLPLIPILPRPIFLLPSTNYLLRAYHVARHNLLHFKNKTLENAI